MRRRNGRIVVVTAMLAMAAAAFGGGLPPPSDSSGAYLGAEACRPCHQTAFEVWTHSDHARASLAFGMRVGRRLMTDAEMREKATGEAFDCRVCHAPPGERWAAQFGPDFHPENGVQCEICHGPGETHVRIETVKDTLGGHRIVRQKKNADLCQVCHYDEKPLHPSELLRTPHFDYEIWWPRIAHATPAGERERR